MDVLCVAADDEIFLYFEVTNPVANTENGVVIDIAVIAMSTAADWTTQTDAGIQFNAWHIT